ncbi:hypothetical protein GYA54_01635 [Candidatus Kuenenbacteria bacterium]|nr:hypothetical protein [Candidatus Kuenenbacteria bacterium]
MNRKKIRRLTALLESNDFLSPAGLARIAKKISDLFPGATVTAEEVGRLGNSHRRELRRLIVVRQIQAAMARSQPPQPKRSTDPGPEPALRLELRRKD